MKLLLLLLISYTAIYKGRMYTPESYPHAITHMNCSMCANIRAQWRAQGWGATNQSYRTETRYKQVKRCNGKRCWYETVAYTVRVPVKLVVKEQIKERSDSTPMPAVNAMLGAMDIKSNDILYDIGSGPDARFLIAAVRQYGCRCVGIEIDPKRAEQSRSVIEQAGLSDQITIVTGNALHQDLSKIRKVVMYQHGDLLNDIVTKLSPGTLVGSYGHKPFASARSYAIDNMTFYIGRIP